MIGEPLCLERLDDGTIIECSYEPPALPQVPVPELPTPEPVVIPEPEDFTVRPERSGFGRG